MQEAMEADQENLLSSGGSFFAEDSLLLSEYLHRQAEKAGNRFLHYTKRSILLRSKPLLTASAQKEEEENSDRCCLPVFKAASSSVKSVPADSLTAQKESSESFVGRECSSQILSELEQEREESAFVYRTLPSSVSCVESSECYESSAEANTRIEVNGESMDDGRFCCRSKETDILHEDKGEHDDDDNNNGVLTADFDNTVALDLLVSAAMQVGFFGEEDDYDHNAAHGLFKRADSVSEADHDRSEDTFSVHGNSPVLKKKVIRRARSAFQKQKGGDLLQRLGIPEVVSRVARKKKRGAAEKDEGHMKVPEMAQDGSHVIRSKRRKLPNMPMEPFNVCKTDIWETAYMNVEDQGNQYKRKRLQDMPAGPSGDCKTEVSEVAHMENDDQGTQSKQGKVQFSPTKLPDVCNTEVSEMVHTEDEDQWVQSKQGELQVSCTKLSDVCNTEVSQGLQMKDRPCRIWFKQKGLQDLPTSELPDAVLKPLEHVVKSEGSEGVPLVTFGRKQKRKLSEEKPESQEREAHLDVKAPEMVQAKNGGSVIRLKILPIRLPSPVLRSLQEVNKSKTSEVVPEVHMITRKSKMLLGGEEESEKAPSMQASELTPYNAANMPDTLVKDGDPVFRSKRGRSQVLPTKFSDSVLQPWKRTSRKNCKGKF